PGHDRLEPGERQGAAVEVLEAGVEHDDPVMGRDPLVDGKEALLPRRELLDERMELHTDEAMAGEAALDHVDRIRRVRMTGAERNDLRVCAAERMIPDVQRFRLVRKNRVREVPDARNAFARVLVEQGLESDVARDGMIRT